ncbi:hypothetical protein M885DRAFT_539917 [Pelagophyceae sp. CCMP2097]|nr:hypothetical protein M885DRAFT_539917 [Pelagophyceae sp. CCMP2097]
MSTHSEDFAADRRSAPTQRRNSGGKSFLLFALVQRLQYELVVGAIMFLGSKQFSKGSNLSRDFALKNRHFNETLVTVYNGLVYILPFVFAARKSLSMEGRVAGIVRTRVGRFGDPGPAPARPAGSSSRATGVLRLHGAGTRGWDLETTAAALREAGGSRVVSNDVRCARAAPASLARRSRRSCVYRRGAETCRLLPH